MRVVLDTVILVRGLINPRSTCGRLVFDYADAYLTIVSPPIVAEYLAVLWRPELLRKYRGGAGGDPPAILDVIARAATVEPVETPAVCRDPEDDTFLAAAKPSGARWIVSEDADLLDIGTYEETAIVSAAAFLRILESPSPQRQT